MRIYFAGAGQCAEYVARRLIREGHDLCLMDSDGKRCRDLEETLDAQVVEGDAFSIEEWRRAGLEKADLFVGCTDSDELNIASCLIANELAPDALKAIRLRSPEFAEWGSMLRNLGVKVDRVVHPETDILRRILRVISTPGISDIRNFADERVKVFSMTIEHGSPLADMSLRTLYRDGVLSKARVSLVFRGAGVTVPDLDTVLLPGDHVYVVTTADALEQALAAAGVRKTEHLRQVFVVGGGELGMELARALEELNIPTKLFEQDPARCEELAEQLPHTTIINADGTSQRILLSENIEGIDAFLPLTGNDDANLIAAVLARRLNVDMVIPLLRRLDYLPLAQRLGINATASPRVKAADALFEFIRGGGVLSMRTLGEEAAEAIELDVPEGSRYAGKPLGELKLPSGTLVGAVAPPGEPALIPTEQTILHPGDRVVFFAEERSVHDLEAKILKVARK
ncbi:MAG: Trk system potassium transporter TrkA [Gammaproteobacteria bacterium]